jgi:hypothetical protein
VKYSDPITAREAVHRVRDDRFVLPGIQRNFVWKKDQICALFDSLLRGYPIGSILVWRTRPGDHAQLPFRRPVRDYRGKTTAPSLVRLPPQRLVDAVLDGQQRLTALNIGLLGSMATSTTAVQRRLWIDLDDVRPDAGSEANMYTLEFLADDEVARADDRAWFPVSAVVGLRERQLASALTRQQLAPTRKRLSVLKHLAVTINVIPSIPIASESTKELDQVLNIFARTNKGGTRLTYVDLLVSTATARWKRRDASAELRGLRDRINGVGVARNAEGFRFEIDRIVKAGLVVLDVEEPKFHVDSFMSGGRAAEFERIWPRFATAMDVAVRTLASFGLSERTLAAQNVVIPITYYAYHRKLPLSYAHADSHARDRRKVRAFVARTLLQRAYWTGAVDPILVSAREAIRQFGSKAFPLDDIEVALTSGTKPIEVKDAFVEELADLRYSDRRTLTLLRMLFPDVPVEQRLDKDHIFPRSKISARELRRAGLPVDDLDWYVDEAEKLSNLQLLDQANNVHKLGALPKQWFDELPRSARHKYTQQGVKHLPEGLAGAEGFWARRSNALETRIRALLSP